MKNQEPSPMNIAFFGTPDLCLPYLDALERVGFAPSLIVTNPDRPQGRKHSELISPAPKMWAEEHNIEVFQPENLDDETFAKLDGKQWDLFIVIAYGKIIPQRIIDIPTYGTLNVHYSLLPRWRGATPTEAAILHGDIETGVTIQQMRFKLDSGPSIAQARIILDGDETTPQLREVLTEIGAEILIETLPEYLNGNITPAEQDENEVTQCGLIVKSDGEVSLDMPDIELWRRYRAYTPWPGLFFFDDQGKRIKITQADFINDKFTIEKVTPEGKKEINWEEYTK
ncbi:methionyl-tRNA formyltransferase [Candidatus Nomurabacteria bacterium]|nr:methionyl-tRNA formyltransferase [Candidatus Nomurabacteria bacterium]